MTASPTGDEEQDDVGDIADPIDVAHLAFEHADGVLIGDAVNLQSYVDSHADGTITADVYTTDKHLAGGGAFRYRIEYLGMVPEAGDES